MKKIATLLILFALCLSATAQHKRPAERQHKEPPRIEDMVSNLSALQKKRLNTVMTDSRKEVDRLQAELDKVCKQICTLIDKEGDQSEQLFALFDREGALRAEISKEKYRTRLLIDGILTKEQIAEVRANHQANCQKPPKKPKPKK